jgi:hypothetical protein
MAYLTLDADVVPSAVRTVEANVFPAEIIGQNVNDIWFAIRPARRSYHGSQR